MLTLVRGAARDGRHRGWRFDPPPKRQCPAARSRGTLTIGKLEAGDAERRVPETVFLRPRHRPGCLDHGSGGRAGVGREKSPTYPADMAPGACHAELAWEPRGAGWATEGWRNCPPNFANVQPSVSGAKWRSRLWRREMRIGVRLDQTHDAASAVGPAALIPAPEADVAEAGQVVASSRGQPGRRLRCWPREGALGAGSGHSRDGDSGDLGCDSARTTRSAGRGMARTGVAELHPPNSANPQLSVPGAKLRLGRWRQEMRMGMRPERRHGGRLGGGGTTRRVVPRTTRHGPAMLT